MTCSVLLDTNCFPQQCGLAVPLLHARAYTSTWGVPRFLAPPETRSVTPHQKVQKLVGRVVAADRLIAVVINGAQ